MGILLILINLKFVKKKEKVNILIPWLIIDSFFQEITKKQTVLKP